MKYTFISCVLFILPGLIGCSGAGSGTNISVTDVGIVEGVITDATTSLPLSGVSVQIGDSVNTSGNNGVFTLQDIAVGSRTITATMTGYQAYSNNVTVGKGITVTHNIPMLSSSTTGSVTTQTGSVQGKAFLSGKSDHSGIIISVGSVTAATSADGSYVVANVPVGNYTLNISYGAAPSVGSIAGRIIFADSRSDNSGAKIALQLAPNDYFPQQIYNVAVFANQITAEADTTLSLQNPIRLTTTTLADGSFQFSSVPTGTYSGLLPSQPDPHAGIYVQQLGTYSIGAVDGAGTIGSYSDGRIDTMRSTNFSFINDPNYQDSRPLSVSTGTTDVGSIVLYPSFQVSTSEVCLSQQLNGTCVIQLYRGMDFSINSSVSSTSASADIISMGDNPNTYPPFPNLRTSIFGNSGSVIQSLGVTDLQRVTSVPGTGYLTQISTTEDLNLPWEGQPDSQVYSVITKEGNYAKVKFLLHSSGDLGATFPYGYTPPGRFYLTFDVLNFYQPNGSLTFDH